ncbi:MAG: hypothetical protein ACD_30C00040G0004 [uncultured bacterium]|uniref:DUF5666 domain-containing protein n=4 Tax=Candidatus Daviesiibacteriota TaxID=1752718 RepID=A0A0G0HV57_9BACT|nr:MAG: hypothetical protein ACD_30C00040G0004 [uncultured bacterium]KKQ07756.1 MAG: hypothetical protein US19_C0038G0008 [Candidatus Daviesbacteria bacterium GW2011_GWB1_36_5]KKQ15060.1 MAG: hypothetical protein US28_C0024G0017 [Candidatus Daviesbacteria bacterium GW2011_GWA1_36_8]OGE17132.1 MAG: hypothetical protein A2858_00300 [Candidatus Daviesbacteria bacterium RIFCSPHIGHO2_01_FULL_36_37]OGE35913.1 MAG: hypothetical protein A3E66_01295 [Candidatus Daviesbacteria bacterium RIFCSPHIGHO2_12_F
MRIIKAIVVSLLIVNCSLFIVPVFAQDKTATQTATESSSLSSKLEDLKKEIASKAAQIKLEVNKKLENKAYVGTVLLNEGSQIKLQTIGGIKNISTNEYTNFESKTKVKPKTKLSIKNIAEGDYIAGLGDIDDKKVLVAKKLIKLDSVATDSAKVVWGAVTSRESYTVHIQTPEDKFLDLITSGITKFFKGSEEASLTDAKKDAAIVSKGVEGDDGAIRSRFIYFVSPGTGESDKQTASPAAAKKP